MDEIKKQVEDEIGSIQEIIQSTRSVKGDKFARLVAASFEVNQVVEMAAHLARADFGDEEAISAIGESISSVLANILEKVAINGGLTPSDYDEALDLGMKMHDRKMALQDRIRSQLNG